MSAFFIAINRDGTVFEPSVARQMMQQLAVFGHDQARLVIHDCFALGYQSHWSVPEEVGECQPLVSDDKQTFCVFDGRIDNREEIISSLSIRDIGISDACLMQQFYHRFGKTRLSEVIGPFAFTVFNSQNGELCAARDGMGGRNLVYKITPQHILIATYEMALVAHPSIEYRFNQSRIARMMGMLLEDRLSSTIEGLIPLSPGELIYCTAQQEYSLEIFYRFDASKRTILKDDDAYAEHYKALLAQAVKRRARSIDRIGSMLSGGFDSVPISILMAQELAKEGQQLTAFSWVFDQYKDADERQYSQAVCQDFNIKQHCIDCDDVWPKFDQTLIYNPVLPLATPYIGLQQAALQSAYQNGVKTVLSGVHGDLLYGYTDSIIWELLSEGRWRDAVKEAFYRYRQSSGVKSWAKQYLLRPRLFVQKYLERRRLTQRPECDWLTDRALSNIRNETSKLWADSIKSLRPTAYELVFSGFAGEDIAHGRYMDACSGIERRYPFRDRDVCEFMLSIPSAQLNFFSINRPLIKRAFKQELRPDLLQRNEKTSFYSVIKAGIENDNAYLTWFNRDDADWSIYVKKCYFDDPQAQTTGLDIVRWQCGYYDYWKSVCYNVSIKKEGFRYEKNN